MRNNYLSNLVIGFFLIIPPFVSLIEVIIIKAPLSILLISLFNLLISRRVITVNTTSVSVLGSPLFENPFSALKIVQPRPIFSTIARRISSLLSEIILTP